MSDEQTWQEKVPETLRATGLVTESKTEEDFWGRIENAQKRLGNSISIPGEDAGQDAITEFHTKLRDRVPGLMPTPNADDESAVAEVMKKLGMPEKSEDYKLPEGVELGEDVLTNLVSQAVETGMTKGQFNKLAKKTAADSAALGTQGEAWKKQQLEAISKEWGLAAEDRIKLVAEFAKSSGAPQRFLDAITSKNVRAEEMIWLYDLSQSSKEVGGMADDNSTSVSTGSLAPFEANEKLEEIYANPDHPFHKNSGNPSHPSTLRVLELVKAANAA